MSICICRYRLSCSRTNDSSTVWSRDKNSL